MWALYLFCPLTCCWNVFVAASDAASRLCQCLPKWHARSAAAAPHGYDPGQYAAGQHGHVPGPYVSCHVRCWQHATAAGADTAHKHTHLMSARFLHCAILLLRLNVAKQAQVL